MYQMPQSYAPCCSGRGEYSPLETIAYAATALPESYAPDKATYSAESLPMVTKTAYTATRALPAYALTVTRSPASYGLARAEFFPNSAPYGSPLEAAGLLPYAASKEDPLFSEHAVQREYHFHPEHFLKPGKEGKFIGKAEDVRPFVEEAFRHMCNEPFPADIMLSVLDEKAFRKIAPHPSTVGLSINRKPYGLVSEIFVLNGSLGRVLLTIGHELGHALSLPLEKPHDEEAKAYAFSLGWMNVVKEHNIAGLQNALVLENPAENGLHNVAFAFVQQQLQQDHNPEEVHSALIRGELSVGTVT